MKLLCIYLQPKDELDFILDKFLKFPHDKLILRYFGYPAVYDIAHKTIQEHPEYTHIFWLQNDIEVDKKDLEKLVYSFQTPCDILYMNMNVDLSPHGLELSACSERLPDDPNYIRYMPYDNKGFHQIKYCGGPCIMSRDTYLQIYFKGTDKRGYNADIQLAKEADKLDKKLCIDFDIRVKHHRYAGVMQVNKKKPEVQFVKH